METSAQSLSSAQVRELLIKSLTNWMAERDRLNDLDRALGDGDHGCVQSMIPVAMVI